jgi:hypothetical protein
VNGPDEEMGLHRIRRQFPDVPVRAEGLGFVARIDGTEHRTTSLILLRMILENRRACSAVGQYTWPGIGQR